MRKLARYLGSYKWVAILAILCVACQAFFELQLPNQMAKLVDIGIQAHGIENSAPTRILRRDLGLACSFLSPEERAFCVDAYRTAGMRSILRLKSDLSEQDLNQLDEDFAIAATAMLYAAHALHGEVGEDALNGSSLAELSGADYESVQSVLISDGSLPQGVLTQARQRALNLQPVLRKQIGRAMAAVLYADAGVSLDYVETIYMNREAAVMAVLVILCAVCSALVNYFAAKGAAGLARNLRNAVFEKASKLPENDFVALTGASLLSRTTSDITLIQSSAFSVVRIVLFAVCMGIGGAIAAMIDSISLAWIVAVAVLATLFVILLIFHRTRPKYHIVQQMIDRLNLIAQEQTREAPTIRAFGVQGPQEERYDEANERLSQTQLKINRILSFLSPSIAVIANLASVFIVWLGAYQTQYGLQIGEILALGQYVSAVLASFVLISGMFVIVPRASVSAERILEVLSLETDLDSDQSAQKGNEQSGLRFENVSYTYSGRQRSATQKVSFCVRPGELTVIVGPTGSGKTTLTRLIVRLQEPEEGGIYLGERDTRQMSKEDLRQHVALVPQKTQYSSNNGNDVAISRLSDFDCEANLSALQNNEETLALSIAHALGRPAHAYVVDDVLSELDPAQEAKFLARLKTLSKTASVLLMSHSVRTAALASHVLVLNKGCIIADGTHAELLGSCYLYQELAAAEGMMVEGSA